MERCPCCNARLTGGRLCPRCQADLSSVLGCEELASYWLNKTVQFWLAGEPQMAILALTKSLYVKQTSLALAFRDFIVEQECKNVLGLLEKMDFAEAKQSLSLLHDLSPHHKFMKQLSGFTRYLMAKEIIERSTRQTINIFNELKYS
jgi:hypothetical protein